MRRILFLTIILFSSTAFAQIQESPKAYKFDEFNSRVGCDVNVRLWNLQNELEKNKTNSAVIITYESIQTKGKIKPMQNAVYREMRFIRFDEKKVKLIDGGFRNERATELWIVPNGAELPKPTMNLLKIDYFGKVSDIKFRRRFVNFFKIIVEKEKGYRGLIKIFGTAKQKRISLRKIANVLKFVCVDLSLIEFVDGGMNEKFKTEFWLVPPNENPLTQNLKTSLKL